ncbi:MAG: MFS transporter [Pseudomonadota bacterium]
MDTTASGAPTDARALGFGTRLSWGIGSLGTIGYLNTVTALILVYLTTIVGLDAAVAGSIVAGARIIDAFSDPLIGWVTDRTKTQMGRRRPYLLLGAIVCGISLPLVYSTHLLTASLPPVAVATGVLVLYSLGFSIFNVPYLAMPVEMTSDRARRIQIMSFRVVFMMLGGLLGNAGAPALITWLGGDADAYQQLGFIAGAVIFVAMMWTFLGTRSANSTEHTPTETPFREEVRSLLSNKPFMTLVAVKVLQFIAIAASASTFAFFVTVVLKQTFNLLSVFGLVTTASILTFVPFWRWMSGRISKKTGFMIGLVGDIFATLLWLVATPENAYPIVIVRGILVGVFSSAILLNSQTMWLDTIDYDRKITGRNREGLYTSVYVFVERLGYSVGPLALGLLLSNMGFDKTLPLDQQPDSAALAVSIGMIWLPAAVYVLAFFFLSRYTLPDNPPQSAKVSS